MPLKKYGVRVRVCQVMFINTLSLGTWSLHNWVSKDHDIDVANTEADFELPLIKRINPKHEADKILLRNFLLELPKMESHY